jgi:hypothetical protein
VIKFVIGKISVISTSGKRGAEIADENYELGLLVDSFITTCFAIGHDSNL